MGTIRSGPIITYSKSSRKGAVDIATPEDLYAKLERTLHRRAAYSDDQFDWVFDFSVPLGTSSTGLLRAKRLRAEMS